MLLSPVPKQLPKLRTRVRFPSPALASTEHKARLLVNTTPGGCEHKSGSHHLRHDPEGPSARHPTARASQVRSLVSCPREVPCRRHSPIRDGNAWPDGVRTIIVK